MDPTHGGSDGASDLGGERACWLDEVCPCCGAIGGHRAGCELVETGAGHVSPELTAQVAARTSRPSEAQGPSSSASRENAERPTV